MNRKLKAAIIIFCAVVVLVVGAVIISSVARRTAEIEPTPSPSATAAPDGTAAPEPTREPEHVNTVSASLAIGGDIVMHSGLNTEALQSDGGYNYTPIFGILTSCISGADYSVCSLVSTLTGGNYSAYPMFRSPWAITASMKTVGFDLVNTATSHCADSFKDGIDSTLEALDNAGLAHVGTYRSPEERESSGNMTVADINGISVAFLSYTFDTNGVPVSGYEYAVSLGAVDYLSGGTQPDYDAMKKDLSGARDAGADIVFVFMSWGTEFSTSPSELQEETADFLFENGADVIIGGHCRVPQPMELREIENADGTTRTGFICYSLGNMLSCQNDEYTDISAIVDLRLTKDTDTGETWISDVSYKPIYMADLYDYGVEDYGWHYRMVDLHAAIDSVENGSRWEFITDEMYEDMVSSLEALHGFYGAELDAVNK